MYNWTRTLPNLKGIATAGTIAGLSCLVLIVLIDHTLDYAMYLFALSLTVLLILQIYRYDFTFKVGIPALSKKIVDYAIIVCSFITLISNYFNNPIQPVAIVFSVFTVLFVPGWAFLRLLDNNILYKKGVALVLTFTISVGLSGIIFAIASFYQVISSPLALAAIYLIISMIPVFKNILFLIHKRENYRNITIKYHSEYRVFEVLLLIWTLIFFSFSISLLYPEMAKLPALDIIRHYSQSEGLLLAPDVYNSLYPWYHFILASILELSGSSMLLFQSIIACLSFMLIFSFYILAKTYLGNIDRRAPVLATVLFTVFAGFGWRYFLETIPNSNDIGNNMQLLDQVFYGTYFDVGYGQSAWIWFWFRPVTLGLIIFFVLLYLPRNPKLGKNKYTIICSLLLITLSQIHFSEFVIFILFVFTLTIFIPRLKLRLKETSLSIIIALVANLALVFSYAEIFNSDYLLYSGRNVTPLIATVLGTLASASIILAHYSKRPFSRLKIKVKYVQTIVVTLGVLFVYVVLLFHWFIDAQNFEITEVFTLLAVPLQFYPMLLGVTGVLAIASIPILITRYKDNPVIIYVIMFILMICVGRLVTYVGSEFSLTGYFERRIVFHAYTAACMFAPIGIFAIIGYLDRKQPTLVFLRKAHIPTVMFISFLVLVGTLSTFLSIQYQIKSVAERAITDGKIEAVQKSINRDPYSTVLTVSSQSNNVAQFSSPGYLIGEWSNQMWPSRSPELPLNILTILNSSFIYVQGNDRQILENKYQNGYLKEHVLEVAPVIYENDSEMVFQLPRLSPTVYSSSMVLVLPDYNYIDMDSYYAYDILSLAGYNYTTAFLSDVYTISNAEIVVVPNESIASKIIQYKKDYNLKYQMLIVLNLNGYGGLWANLTNLSATSLFNTDENNNGNSGNQLGNWTGKSYGSGKIGSPKVIDASIDNPLSGRKASKITVEQGNNSLWQISKTMPETHKLSKFDFIQFDWYGRGDERWYVLEFNSVENQYFGYRFQDSSKGWNRIILPLHIEDGRWKSFGVLFDKYSEPGASWSDIVNINFRPDAQNVNQQGHFYLDGFYLGTGLESSGIRFEGVIPARENHDDQTIIPLSSDVELLPYFSKFPVNEVASYDGTSVPFILENRSTNNFSMFYINIYPITRQLPSVDGNSAIMFTSLGRMLEFLPNADLTYYNSANRSSSSLIADGVAAFDRATFEADIKAQSSSAIIDNIGGSSVEITVDGRKSSIEDVSRIVSVSTQNLTVQGYRGGILGKGYGFYSSLITNQSSITAVGNPAMILAEINEGANQSYKTAIFTGKEIQLNLSKSSILLRQPTVLSNGIANFKDFYAYGALHNKLPALGQDVRLEGQNSFKIDYSDEFTIMSSASLKGKHLGGQIAYPYEELGNLSKIFGLPYAKTIAVLLVLFVVLSIYLLDKKIKSHADADPKRINRM